ncbi:MAG: class I SAM-dependent methyltransferase [Pseudomonadota bacterium]
MPFSTATLIILLLWVASGGLLIRNIQLRRRLRKARAELAQKPRVVHVPHVVRDAPVPKQTHRETLLAKLGLEAADLPAGGDWRAGDDLLNILVDHIFDACPDFVVECGSGLSTAVLAQALKLNGQGHLFTLEHDIVYLEETKALLDRLGVGERVTLIEAPLVDYGPTGKWYDRAGLEPLPARIDLLLVDGPPVFAGKAARYPAGPELFARLSRQAVVILDDGRRNREQKALRMWRGEYPDLHQQAAGTQKGAVVLRREGDIE